MTKLQRAGRDFLLRLIAEHGLAAARILRALADEQDQREQCERSRLRHIDAEASFQELEGDGPMVACSARADISQIDTSTGRERPSQSGASAVRN